MSRKSALDDLFARYAAAVQSLFRNVVVIEEQDTIACCHRHEAYKKALLEEEFTKWFNSARQFVPAESTLVSTPGVISPEVPCRTSPEFQRDIPHETSLYIPAGLHLSFYGRFHARPQSTFLTGLHLRYKARICP